MKEIKIQDFNENVFKLIGDDWLLINSYNEEKVNSMTASWGGLGFLWNKNVAYIFVRPQRYTQELLPNNEYFSISVLGEEFRKELNYLGSASGRDEDKLEKAGLTIEKDENGAPILKEARLNIMVKKLLCQQFSEESFIEKSLVDKHYPNKDFHYMYVVEVLKIIEN
ncbi:MAG: flavin reductase family protein [Tissierellia bacterium]|nr:flavin reductase family protein [Tissierellia bacterium]